MGIQVMVKPYPNPYPNSPGNSNQMQMRCKWGQLDEYIKNKYIPVSIPNWNNFLIRTFSFLRFFFLLSISPSLLFHSWSSGTFSPSDPAPWEGRLASSASTAPDSLVLPRRGGFRSGDRWPSHKFCPRKNGTPQSGLLEIHARVKQVVLSFRMTASTVRSSGSPLSLFSRGRSPVPPQRTSGFPLPEKNPKTHGVLAKPKPRLCSSRDESRPHLKYENLRERSWGYRFRRHNSCGTTE